MKIINSNEQGFSPVEVLLVLITLIIIGTAGYFVAKHIDSNKTTPSTNSANSLNTGWLSYSDSVISIKYPNTWAEGTSPSGVAGSIEVSPKQPTAQTYYSTPGATNGGKVFYELDFYENTPNGTGVATDCTTTACDILATYPLSIKNDSNAKLIIYNATNQNQIFTNSAVVDDSTAKVGSTTFKEGLTVNGKTLIIQGLPIYIEGNSVASDLATASVNNLAQFEQSSDFQNSIKVLNSLVVK